MVSKVMLGSVLFISGMVFGFCLVYGIVPQPRLMFDLMFLLTMICLLIWTIRKRREEKSTDRSERRTSWFWYLLLIGYVFLSARSFEPLKTINEMFPAPWYLLMLVFFIGGAVWFTIAFREGKVIR